MLCAFVRKSKGSPTTWKQLEHAVRRNFDGLDGVEPMTVFSKNIHSIDQNAQVG